MDETRTNSSAYSSLTHDDVSSSSEAVTVVSSNEGRRIQQRVTEVNLPPSKSGGDRPIATSPRGTTTSASLEIRNIIEDYNGTLKRATDQIKALTAEKKTLEVDYEKLLTVNENLADDLERTLRRKKRAEEERRALLEANDELYREAQRLTDLESKWSEEKESLEGEVIALKKELTRLERLRGAEEAADAIRAEQIEKLEKDNVANVASVARLELENKNLEKAVRQYEEERETLLNRNERVSGENMQLILDSQEFLKIKSEMTRDLKELKTKYKESERVNKTLTAQLENSDGSRESAQTEERLAKIVEQNKNLTEWREQLIEKNRSLSEENKKLKDKCANLEELLNEEETDISDVLELIRTMQVASSKSGGVGVNPGPINPMSAIGAKLRDMNFK